jgi:SAM-dependent methyltransferase
VSEVFTPLPCTADTTIGMDGCAEHRVLRADMTINRDLKRLWRTAANNAARAHIAAAQAAWQDYRKAACLGAVSRAHHRNARRRARSAGKIGAMSFYGDHVLPHIINVVMDNKQTRLIRARVCGGLNGEVLEIGFGTGHNLPFIPGEVTRLQAVEPSKRSVELARTRIAAAPFAIEVIGLDGQRLGVEDESVDAVLCTWSLCTIPDPVAAVAEARRVLRVGGRFHFVEHGLAPDEKVRRWQDRWNPAQQKIAGGCNVNRDISAIIEAGGLTITSLDNYYGKGEPKTLGAMYEGVAVAT